MPFIERHRHRIFYEETGSGPAIVLGHSFLCSGEMWEKQVPVLAESYRVINIDYRGHGQSSTAEERFDVYDLVDDTTAILDELGVERAIWAGLSTGGFAALRAALTVPERVRAIVVADASAAAESSYSKFKYRTLGIGARLVGMRPFVPVVVPIMFGQTTLKENPELVEEWTPALLSMDLRSLLRFLEAIITRDSLLDRLPEIDVPALIMAGEEDRAQPVFRARQMADGIPGARLEIIPQAGHLSALEQPEAFNRALLDFLTSLPD
jgi:pimeloyl-ACP methyl ester carboxylesterase